jgi:hypothetical protein
MGQGIADYPSGYSKKIFKNPFTIPDWDTNFQITIPPELHNLGQTDAILATVRDGVGNDVVVDINVTPTGIVTISAIEAFDRILLLWGKCYHDGSDV